MKHFVLFASALLILGTASAQMPASRGLGFTPNEGQFADQAGNPAEQVLFKACGSGPGIFVTTSGLSYVFTEKKATRTTGDDDIAAPRQWAAIHMNLVGADIRRENIVMEDELPGVSNYYFPHCPNGILGVKSYHRITIRNIYPGIDWVITADDVNGVAHDFYVHDNGNYKNIVMEYAGLSAPISINEKGELALTSPLGTIYEGGLKVINQNTGAEYTSYFNIYDNRVNYLVMHFHRGSIIIDPPLQWMAPQASTGYDYGAAIAAAKDASGDVMGGGQTDGVNFPVMNATQGLLYGTSDAVVFRLDGSGNRLWSTFFGGTDDEIVKGIAADVNGNCYTTGYTNSQDLPVMNSLQANYGGGVYDAFIAKYNSAGVMQWASWRGGTGSDFAMAITADDTGTTYVVGYTNTTVNFPLLNPIQPTKAGSAGVYDGFVMSVSASQVMQWSTYYGGTDEDKFRAVALDATGGNIAIAGNTMSGNFPTAGNPFQLFNGQAWFTSDGVIMKMTANQSVVFASYCGGYEDDFATGITFDDNGNIYASGYTVSSDFPKVDPGGSVYSDTTLNAIGVQDAFIVKCNGAGTTLLWSTYFGGMSSDYGFAIGYDQFVGIYVCGNTASTDFPVMQPADMNYYQSTHGDGGNFNDMWIAWFDINDSLRWSTYYGGGGSDEAYGIDIGMQNDIFVIGVDSNDIAVLKFNPGIPTSTVSSIPSLATFVYPNPVGNELSLQFYAEEQGASRVEIYDNNGRLVQSDEYATASGSNLLHVNTGLLAEGVYSVKLVTPGGKSSVQRFVKSYIRR